MTPGFYAENTGTSNSQVAPAGEAQSEDSMCTICFSNDSNCIIMDCKHSGVCKDCSLDMIKKAPVCPFCRTVI